MRSEIIKFTLLGLLAVAAQILLFRHLTIFNNSADVVLVYLIWAGLHTRRSTLLIVTAFTAFFQDAFLDLWGINMFVKTLTLFLTYGIIQRSRDSQPLFWQVFLGVLAISLLHNIIFVLLSAFIDHYATEFIFATYLLGGSAYTALVGTGLHALSRN
jgi:hypothetical protein